MVETLLQQPVYGLPQSEKQSHLLAQLNQLTQHHYDNCEPYRRLLDAEHASLINKEYSDLIPLAVRLFKLMRLSSVKKSEEFKVMHSSGTTSSVVSQVVLDRQTASLQSKVLVAIFKEWIGGQRLPMLIIDRPGLTNKTGYSARGAGVQGLSFLGRNHCYALDENMQIRWPEVLAFAEQFRDQPVLIFGFTFMVWQYFLMALQMQGVSLELKRGYLFHSGGWKKLQERAVDNGCFKSAVMQHMGELRVHNFYGMVEQTGSVYVECEHGHLHAPIFSDLMIRDKMKLTPLPPGESGLIQVFSSLPHSYPGHSILTEDLGRIIGVDDCPCGRRGLYFEVQGRLPAMEVRGCSDTFQ